MARYLEALALLVAAAGLLSAILAFAGGLWTGFDILEHLRLHMAAAALLFAAGAAALGVRWAAGGAALAVTINVAAVCSTPPAALYADAMPSTHGLHTGGAATITEAAAPQGAPPTLRIMSFNILKSTDNAARAAALIAAERPDIVALQEFQHRDHALLDLLAKSHPHRTYCSKREACGVALFSARPWRASGIIADESHRISADHHGRRASVAWAVVEAPGVRPVLVMDVHPRKPIRRGRQQVDYDFMAAQLEALRPAGAPVIVAGDFNATPWSRNIRWFAKKTGLRWARHWQPTYSDRHLIPSVQIDHIFVSDDIRLQSIAELDAAGSDHRAIIAELVLPAAKPEPRAAPVAQIESNLLSVY
ncbi:MAG: endonuclease/exonuclease/phosphatase family protein [Pseudomonadota bacterium]